MLRVLLAFCLFCPVILAQDPEVDTSYGTVRGKAITLDDGSVINTYMAVPYAKPPVGELRFTVSNGYWCNQYYKEYYRNDFQYEYIIIT